MNSTKPGTDRIGFFGKIPTHGDFVSGSLGTRLREELDSWIQDGLASCEQAFGQHWQVLFRSSAPWRFVIQDHLWIPGTIVGVLLPSQDRVGRCFPLIIAAQLSDYQGDPRQLCHDKTWFIAAEALAETSRVSDFDLAELSTGLKRLRLPHAQARSDIPSEGTDNGKNASIGSSIWWMFDPDTGRAHGFKTAGPPKGADFLKLLSTPSEPSAQAPPTEAPKLVAAPFPPNSPAPPLPGRLVVERSYATHPGTRLFLNSDALLISDAPCLFAIADGVGDAISAAEAAKVTIKTLADSALQETLSALIQDVKQKLGRAQGLLQSASWSDRHGKAPMVSVATLAILEDAFAVVWAGDVRCYLIREGTMRCLTRDHLQIGMHRQLSRCVGGLGPLVPDVINDTMRSGDRLLLCSGSLPRVLGERSIARTLLDAPFHDAPAMLVQEALIANVRDNISAILLQARLE
ncbi:type VI secretion system-associated protein TagF [Paramesorhizobium deserti]|nr:type VI secretion system-associated protein TagF [Paramesorhizobium deserti]